MPDKTKLSRDYEKQPLGTYEDIPKSDLEYLYNDSGMTKTDICKYLPCCTAKLYRLIKKYDITKKVEQLDNKLINKIDWSRLRRNYIEDPLKYGELPTKDEFVYLYKELELTREEISKLFGRGNSERFAGKLVKLYQVKTDKDVSRRRAKETYKDRTGYETPLANPEIHKKAQETCLKKYGVTSWMKTEAAKQAQGTILNTKEQIERAKKKREHTNIERYGVKNPLMLDEYKEKQHAAFLKKYNADSYPQSLVPEETREILSDPGAVTQLYIEYNGFNTKHIAELIGVSASCLLDYVHKYGLECLIYSSTSSFERELISYFPTITFTKDRTILDGKEIDLYAKDYKIGIEFNGNYWHSDAQKTPTYHRDKSRKALKRGVFLFHIFEYEWVIPERRKAIINRLRNLFQLNTEVVYARKCTLSVVEDQTAQRFLNENHVQGEAFAPIKLGLLYNSSLVALMTFSTNKLDKDHQYELTRFCCKAGMNVVGGASKLFKYFLDTYNPTSIVSYSDDAKATGDLYVTLGFKHIRTTYPQYHWTDGNTTLTRYKTQRKQLTKLGWLTDGDTRSESEVMRAHGFFKIYDCGKKVWSWINPRKEIL